MSTVWGRVGYLCILLVREGEREDFALLFLFYLYHLVCVAFDWGVNHCASGPLLLWQQLEKGDGPVLMSVNPLCTAVLTVSMQLEGSWPWCSSFLKNWKGLPGTISSIRNICQALTSCKSPTTIFFFFFFPQVFLSLLTCLYFQKSLLYRLATSPGPHGSPSAASDCLHLMCKKSKLDACFGVLYVFTVRRVLGSVLIKPSHTPFQPNKKQNKGAPVRWKKCGTG